MPTIVYQTNPKTGVKYAYVSTSYWDKEKKAPRSTRKYLGRVDPETGEIVKGAGKNRKVVAVVQDGPADAGQVPESGDGRDAEIASLKARLAEMTARCEEAERLLGEIRKLAGSLKSET